jgi:hypothetical protein
MMPTIVEEQAPVPPPCQAKQGPALHVNALTLVMTLHLLAPCRSNIFKVWKRPFAYQFAFRNPFQAR